ncbi:MAG: hypothetical protein A2350_00800 [Candidatus Raymondbacteria bacterium RifOxyB12_full_50_8]|uniref:DUF362 domain-containing protein n=1 Tax=Candidatus Raymondbacteria bacterium RIFOXYD12_FULL_49_13 TaxID=1817890 RepID=A0A1F7FLT3_UNCRA|nr:MAG: hypothetical protein A2248_15790 [Candidatus Raymondbacteria bacterium RIFOXYA2_FULL_49_16]OGJ96079.1 MAG: hypothetical protein A2453_08330 [Candidatus Raymondbacteria bacterium RIFOXYC2_FULL_50_21]OGK01850.1 MAG: hypothetical protein A2350_00800 [Candidatus Raymondbacteria bacterium RifOxyB12_full_50_8]OGK07628.1 MAG: hypothetical protein A2519_21940 [Candidatus Raymondbacteria bacterium RIFOXYD12_FULL_49_13]OGP40476.1 MAG: hypothetical protein A2324_00195 [Candidatus Raymondbacteria b
MFKPRDNLVSVGTGQGPYGNIRTALSKIDLSPVKGKKVLVKPNAGRFVEGGQGITTHPDAVAAVIDTLREADAASITLGESPILGVKTLAAFEKTGIAAIADKTGVPLLDMDKRKPVIRQVKNGRVLTSLKFCADIFDFDIIVSVPVAKTHMHTQVSLGIKNMKGCLWRNEKVRLHQLQYKKGSVFPEKTLDTAISDMASLFLPDLTVIDGYIGMEGLGPSAGTPVTSNFALASWNPLAADKAGCELMGFTIDEVTHLRLVRDRKLCPLEDVAVLPANYLEYKVPFARSPSKLDIAFPNVVVHDKGACSACTSTLLLFLKRFADELGDYVFPDGKIHVGIGKDIDGFPEGTILIGNCTAQKKAKGKFVPGCPPVASRIYRAITGVEPETNEPDIR